MKKQIIVFYLLLFFLQGHLAAQVFIKYKDLEKYAKEAKDSSNKYFVVYQNGDTVKGNSFVKKQIKGKPEWTLEDSIIAQKNIHSYQDEYGYVFINNYTERNKWYKDLYGDEFTRLFKGKVSLFASQIEVENARTMSDNEVITSENFRRQNTKRIKTTFFITKNQNALDRMQPVSPKLLEELVSDFPPAIEKVKQEFNKINDKETNNYPKIIAVLKVYNERK